MKIFSLILLFAAQTAFAKVYGPSATEVEFSYQATFITQDLKSEATSLIVNHASHLFGLMSMPNVVQSYGLNHELVGGIGAPKWPMRTRVIKDHLENKNSLVRKIQFSIQGRMILHNAVAEKVLAQQSID